MPPLSIAAMASPTLACVVTIALRQDFMSPRTRRSLGRSMVNSGISRLLLAASIPNGKRWPADAVNTGFVGADGQIATCHSTLNLIFRIVGPRHRCSDQGPVFDRRAAGAGTLARDVVRSQHIADRKRPRRHQALACDRHVPGL